jgi:hypothetical protein
VKSGRVANTAVVSGIDDLNASPVGDAEIACFGLITPEPFAEVWNGEPLPLQIFATIAAARLPNCSKYLDV